MMKTLNTKERISMSILNAFDNKSKPMVDITSFYGSAKHFADICIVSFSSDVKEMLLRKYKCEVIAHSGTVNGKIEVYMFEVDGKKLLFYMSPIGSAVAATVMHEVHHIAGPTKFIVYGSCGVLDNEKCRGRLIIPTESYRDEGISYHYMEPSEYIDIKNSSKIADIFDKYHYPYVMGRTWTTDAIYMETINKVAARRSEGCITVQMEASGLQAVANYYGYDLYTFFFGADLLDGECWDKANLGGESEKDIQRETFNMALNVALNL